MKELLKEYLQDAGKNSKEDSGNLFEETILADGDIGLSEEELGAVLNTQDYIGCASVQVSTFIEEIIRPIIKEHEALLGIKADIHV